MAVTKIKPIKSTLKKALDYIQNPNKTDGKMLVSSFGCSYETADIEFGFTLSQALDRGNNLAHHLIQSFEPGEVDYEKAHEIGKQLADAVTKGQYEYVLTTHIDKGHIHNHIIFCAVNFVDYHKYVSNKRTYYGIRNISDRLCRENGLSTVQIKEGKLLIDGKPLKAEYVSDIGYAGTASEPVHLGKDEYFLLGDNETASDDSREEKIGNIKKKEIYGEVWFVIKPWSDIGFVSD